MPQIKTYVASKLQTASVTEAAPPTNRRTACAAVDIYFGLINLIVLSDDHYAISQDRCIIALISILLDDFTKLCSTILSRHLGFYL